MVRYIIEGANPLSGKIKIQGSKNSAVAIILASIAVDGITELYNVPAISDVVDCLNILSELSCFYYYKDSTTLVIDTEKAKNKRLCSSLTSSIRASSYLLGASLSRFGYTYPIICGGCDFGSRPLDYHIQAIKSMGATESEKNNEMVYTSDNGLFGSEITFKRISVGATVNAVICAVKARGTTVIYNAATEPHVCELCNYLNKCGACISGIGTHTLSINGTNKLKGCVYEIKGDMIEAGTYALAAMMSGGRITLSDAPIDQMTSFIELTEKIGACYTKNKSELTVSHHKLDAFNVITEEYPGFPTDLQPQISALAGICSGESRVTEAIFSNRFSYLEQLKLFGTEYRLQGNTAVFKGTSSLTPAHVHCTDLRGGAALLITALSCKGVSTLDKCELIERGYSDIINKINGCGGKIKRFII